MGGFCAAKLLVRHPRLFHAAVGLGAYYDAETDRTTGDLFKRSMKLRNANSPIWLMQHAVRGVVTRLLIVVSQVDRASYNGYAYADSKQMIEATQGAPGVATLVLTQGGHNYRVYRTTLPQTFAWLGRNASLEGKCSPCARPAPRGGRVVRWTTRRTAPRRQIGWPVIGAAIAAFLVTGFAFPLPAGDGAAPPAAAAAPGTGATPATPAEPSRAPAPPSPRGWNTVALGDSVPAGSRADAHPSRSCTLKSCPRPQHTDRLDESW